MSEPLVGIALAAYKPDVEYFRAQLQSIADQTYTNWFCVVGFDSPIEEVRREPALEKFFDDARFEFQQNRSRLGLVSNFESTGRACLMRNPKYICYSDQDDIWLPTKTARLAERIENAEPMSVVHCDMKILAKTIDGNFEVRSDSAWAAERRGINHVAPLDFFIRNVVAGAGMIMDAELVNQFPIIPGDVYGQDHWYPTVASFFGGVHALAEPLYHYRIHGNNLAGVSEYRGFFAHSKSSSEFGLIEKCVRAFNTSRQRYVAARAAGLPTSILQKTIVQSKWDLGLGYFLRAVANFVNDRALSRACLARAMGKILRMLGMGTDEVTRV